MGDKTWFRDEGTWKACHGETSRKFSDLTLVRVTQRRFLYLKDAQNLYELGKHRGHRLHALHYDRKGQHSITVTGPYRLCFVWTSEGPRQIELVDYHK